MARSPLSSLSKKVVMALTGLMLLGFVVMHLSGNLLIFWGQNAFNAYAVKLSNLGPLLWAARLILLAAAIAHVVTSVQITLENRAARPLPYDSKQNNRTSWAARTMALSGLVVLAFLIYHLLHFTFRLTNPDISHGLDPQGRHDLYTLVVLSFQQIPIVASYVAALTLLFLHLSHGIGSFPQSLGMNNERSILLFQRAGRILALLIYLGYISIPLSVLLGLVGSGS